MQDLNNPSINLTGYQVRFDSMQVSLVKAAKITLWSESTLLPSSTVLKDKSKPFIRLAIKLEVKKLCMTCLWVSFEDVCVWNKPSNWFSQNLHSYV